MKGLVVGVVLAGGASRRLGRDKAHLLNSSGQTLAERAVAVLREVADEVLLADAGRTLVGGVESLEDGPGAGPAAGLLAAAAARPGRPVLALACDLPAVPVALLSALSHQEPAADLFWPRWVEAATRGANPSIRLEPLCARWSPRALARLAQRVAAGRRALYPLAEEAESTGRLTVRFLEGSKLEALGTPREMFLNVNTPGDWQRWIQQQGG